MVELICAALLIGFVAGLRAFMAPTIVSWAATVGLWGRVWGVVHIMQAPFMPGIFTGLALFELIFDKLPFTPTRKAPIQLLARMMMGGLAGATIGAASISLKYGLVCGIVGAIIGTFVGAAVRKALARLFGRDWPAALLEDVVAIGLGITAIFIP